MQRSLCEVKSPVSEAPSLRKDYGIGTDSTDLQFYDTGRPSISLSVPAHYMHNHNSVIDRQDLDRAVDLKVKLLVRLDAKTVAEISRF